MNGDEDDRRAPIGGFEELTPLEREAQSLLRHRSGPDEPVLGTIERQIESVLDQSEELRELHRDLDRDLLRSECRLGTDLLRLREHRYGLVDREPQRTTIKRRLEQLGRERRSIALELHARRRALSERLASLLERHQQTRGDGR